MADKAKRTFFFGILLVLLVFGGTTILLNVLINYPPFQQYLIHQLSQKSQYDLTAGKIRIGYLGGLGIHADRVKAQSKQASHHLEAAAVDVAFNYTELLRGRFIPAKIFVQDARLRLKSDGKPDPDISTRLPDFQAFIGPLFSELQLVQLSNATVFVEKNDFGLKNLDVLIGRRTHDHRQRNVRAEGLFSDADSAVPFQLEGIVSSPAKDTDTATVEMALRLTDLPLERVPWPDEVRFDDGRATTELKISGPVGTDLTISGQATGKDLRFAVTKRDRSKSYDIPSADIHFRGRAGLKNAQIEKLTLRMPDAVIALSMDLDWREAESTAMDLDINARPMPLPVFKRIFPTPLVPEWIETSLFPLFKDGSARMDRFRLSGTIDQIKKLKRPENSNALEMRLILEGLTALHNGPGLPATGVEGTVEINQGRLLVSGVEGTFGESHLRRGSMTWPDLFGGSDVFNLGIHGNFLLEDLKTLGVNSLLPQAIRYEIDQFETASGELATDINLLFSDPRRLPMLTGQMTLKSGQIRHTALPLPFDLVNSRIIFNEKGPVEIYGDGRWGGSTFEVNGTTGHLWDANGKIPRPHMDLAITADFDLADVSTVRHVPALPVEFRTACAGIKTIKGRLVARFKVRRSAPGDPTRLAGIFTTSGASMMHTRLKFPLAISQGKLEITDKENYPFSASGTWGRSSFTAGGMVAPAKGSMRITLSTQADVNEIVEGLVPQWQPQIHLNKLLKSDIRIQKNGSRWSFEGKADLDRRVFQFPALVLEPPGSGNYLIFSGYCSPELGVVLKSDLYIGKSAGLEIPSPVIHGTWKRRPEGNHTVEIVSYSLDLADLGTQITDKNYKLKGILQGYLNAGVDFDRPEETRVNGELTLDGCLIGEAAPPTPCNADLQFEDRSINIISLTIPHGEGKSVVKGRITGWDKLRGHLNLSTDRVDLPRLIRQFSKPKPTSAAAAPARRGPLSSLLSKSVIDVDIRADQVLWETVDIGNMVASTAYRNDSFIIAEAVFTAPDEIIKLSGTLFGDKAKGTSLTTHIKLHQRQLEPILRGLGVHTSRIKGTISVEGDALINGRNKNEISRNLEGQFNIEMTEGEVNQSNVIVKILDFLSIQNIFKQRPPDILKNRFYFESIQGELSVKKGVFTTDRLFLQSPVFNAAARGRFELVRDYVNILVGVEPLNTIDKIVSKIPIIGYILTGKKKTILVYYLKIRGPLDDLVLKQIPLKNLDEAIAGYFKRLFLTPKRLWSKIFDTLEDLDKAHRSDPRPSDETDLLDRGP